MQAGRAIHLHVGRDMKAHDDSRKLVIDDAGGRCNAVRCIPGLNCPAGMLLQIVPHAQEFLPWEHGAQAGKSCRGAQRALHVYVILPQIAVGVIVGICRNAQLRIHGDLRASTALHAHLCSCSHSATQALENGSHLQGKY